MMNKFFFIILVSFFLYSCQSTKEGFTLKKKSSADEFLVEKKNPLVLPPDYGKLPIPGSEEIDENNNDDEEKINIILNTKPKTNNPSKSTSIEKSILDKIK